MDHRQKQKPSLNFNLLFCPLEKLSILQWWNRLLSKPRRDNTKIVFSSEMKVTHPTKGKDLSSNSRHYVNRCPSLSSQLQTPSFCLPSHDQPAGQLAERTGNLTPRDQPAKQSKQATYLPAACGAAWLSCKPLGKSHLTPCA